MASKRLIVEFRGADRGIEEKILRGAKSALMSGRNELKTFFQVGRSHRIEKNRIEQGEKMSIFATANGKPLELVPVDGYMVIFTQTENEPNAEILNTLKFIELFHREIWVASVSVV